MELPFRAKGDQLLPLGELTDIRKRLRLLAAKHDLTSVISCAFDYHTRMLPFLFVDTRMVPAGVRAIGSALVDSGFTKTRIVLQQWNRRFRPSAMRLDGRIPDLFCVSSMSLHKAEAHALLRDVHRIDPAQRPLVIAGGSICIYEPWSVFSHTEADPFSPDLAVTGEEYVFLNFLETLLSCRRPGEGLRAAFLRARDEGALDSVPGVIYGRGGPEGRPEELIDTGIQRLVSDLDETPHPVLGYAILNRPGRGHELSATPLEAGEVQKYNKISSLVMTFGCKYGCGYCPIPGYNQRNLRFKSGERIADEMARLNRTYGLSRFFGADDNFFNDKDRVAEIIGALEKAEDEQGPVHRRVLWGTEAAVNDTWALREMLPAMYRGGLRALWVGVEDMTGALIRKGQTVDRTVDVFKLLCENGIAPMPMMMHHDGQPLYTRGRPEGLLNQVNVLRKAGAIGLQVLMMTPSAGSKMYEQAFRSGMVYKSVAGRPVVDSMFDGNYVIASNVKKPWRKQINLMLAYLFFYNGFRLIVAIFRKRTELKSKQIAFQVIGIIGLAFTIRRTLGWMFRLMFGRIHRLSEPFRPAIPMRSPDGAIAAHDLPSQMSPAEPAAGPETSCTPADA
ncbi:MAG: radical SAM protein [Planctomycetota bacterium]|nr:radical SAM protein [Planctomycetota bacterium]